MFNLLNILRLSLEYIVLLPIYGYRFLISPLLGNNCRFYPSCSNYMIASIKGHGICKGIYLGTKRILRCHPYHEGGIDPVPACNKISSNKYNNN